MLEANVSLWTESSVVLTWIKGNTPLKLYVANRVPQILHHSEKFQWRHVPTSQYSANIISRGSLAKLIHNNMLWWTCPQLLQGSKSDWPTMVQDIEEIPEVCCIKFSLTAVQFTHDLLERYSSWVRLIRITG